jgi:autotransporter-associated beta strand protein
MNQHAAVHNCRPHALFLAFSFLSLVTHVAAQSDTWSGSTSAIWTDSGNWVSGNSPGTGHTATFLDGGNGNTTIDLSTGVAIGVIQFNAGAASYTIGAGGVSAQTLTFDDGGDINLATGVAANQTVAASIILGDGTGNNSIILDNDSSSELLISGNITSGSGTAQQTLRAEGTGLIELAGIVTAGGSRLTLESRGNLTISGNVVGTGNTQRTIVRNGGILTTTATGLVGQGNLDLRHGTVNLNNTTNVQLFDDGIFLGDTTLGDGNATLNIGSGVTVELDSSITYQADDNTANVASIIGGTIDLSLGTRFINVADNALVDGSELILETDFKDTSDTTASADLIITGSGTVTWGSTINTDSATEKVDLLDFNTRKVVIAESGNEITGLRRNLRVRQRNSATTGNWDVEMDINGQTLLLDDDLILGAFNNASIAPANLSNVYVTDSADTESSLIRLTGDNDIQVQNGNSSGSTGGTNKTAFIEADIRFEGGTMTLVVQDGADDVDLEISGTIRDDTNGGRTVQKTEEGTVRLTATNNLFNVLQIYEGTAQVVSDGSVGDNDIQLGNNNTRGQLEYIGTGGSINNQFRLGDNDTGTTAGNIVNSGTGLLTLNSGTFNEARASATTNRELIIGGSSDIEITGAIVDNAAAVATVAINKSGSNTLTLSGDSTFTGNTNVNEGGLQLDGSLTSNVTFADMTAAGGDGSTTGNISFAGANITLNVDASTSAGLTTTSELISTGGNVTVDFGGTTGSNNIVIADYGTYTGTVGSEFQLASGTTTSARGGAGTIINDTLNSQITVNLGFLDLTWNNASTNSLWDGNTSANWTTGRSDTTYFDGDSVTFSDTGSGTVTLSGGSTIAPGKVVFDNTLTSSYSINASTTETLTVAPGGGLQILTDNSSADITINAELVGTGVITKGQTVNSASNVGQTIITGNNTNFSGTTLINQGDVQINNANGLGNDRSNSITMKDFGDDGRLILNFSDETFINDIIIDNQGGTKILRFDNGNNSANRALTVDSNILIRETSSAFRFDIEGQNETLGNTHVLTMTGKISSDFIEADGAVEKADQGTLILNNDSNDFTGRLHVNSGFAKVTSIGNIGEASAIGAVRSNFSDFHIRLGSGGTDATPLQNSGTLSYIGTSDESTDRIVRIGNSGNTQGAPGSNGGAVISNDSPNNSSLRFTNTTFNDPEDTSTDRISSRQLSLEGTSTAVNTIDGVISDNFTGVIIDETVSVNVDTSGTWQLNGASTYTGNTTVNDGTLRVNGSLASGSLVTVSENGTLAGSGTIGGNVSFASGATHTGGDTAAAAVQTLSGDVSYASGATVSLNLVSNSTTVGQFDQFAVAGSLSFGTSLSNDLTLEISFGDNVNIEDPFWNSGAFTNEWKVWDYTTLATNFADSDFTLSLSADSTGAGLALIRAEAFEIANTNFANDNAGVWLRQIAPIPEPSTYALMGLGLAAFGWFSRRRRQKPSE